MVQKKRGKIFNMVKAQATVAVMKNMLLTVRQRRIKLAQHVEP